MPIFKGSVQELATILLRFKNLIFLASSMTNKTSQVPEFYKLPIEKRREFVKKFAGLIDEDLAELKVEQADRMIENAIGTMAIPLGVATNFLINGKDYLIPMAIEEPSVVAAASHSAKLARAKGGFFTSSTEPIMIGQIQAVGIADPHRAKLDILARKAEILKVANETQPQLVSLGGGARDLRVRVLENRTVITELLVDCRDAMGANMVNTMAETVAPMVEKISGGRVYLRILSNLADLRLVRAKAVYSKEALGGKDVVDGIVAAYEFAAADTYRCATHNKGVMNGITAVVLATGNDTRAIEAGAHSYAARSGTYSSLTVWEKDGNGDLVGTIEVPMAVGLVGGATKVHPTARLAVKILGVKTARELGEVIASAGLAQNLAAMKALATVGIQKGHMALHARNVAVEAGATGELLELVVDRMVSEGKVRLDRAKEIVTQLKEKDKRLA